MKILEYIKLYFKNKVKIKGKNNKIILEKSKVKKILQIQMEIIII